MNEPESAANMEQKCPQCGAVLPSGALSGLCPGCLLAQAAHETAVPPGPEPFTPPTVEELAALFPQLEIRALIGRGGMGAVYQARQPALDRIVALKVLPARTGTGADFAERFNREARALAKLNHPNIVSVYEFGQANGLPFFIMEYVDGVNLRQLEQAGKLSPREALQIVPQICEALQFAHDAGVVHRDIKPDNILVDKKGRVKIADFGIAKIMGAPLETGVAETQGAIGTPDYMAPEQIEQPQAVDHRADIFSLGVVFYEMLTGELPLGKFAPPASGARGVRVDVRLDEVVLRALEKEPGRRYQHASQVKTAVETIAGQGGAGSPGAQSAPPSSGPAPEELLARDYRLDIGRCLSRGWALMRAHFWELAGIHTLMMLLLVIAGSTFARIGTLGHTASDGTSILGLLLTGPLIAGLFLYFLKTMRGEPTTVETAFAGFSKRFLHLFLANLVASGLIGLGLVCFVLPGIYLLVAWCFTLVLVMDKELEFWPAMELSRKMVNKHWWLVFGFLLVLAGIWLAGVMACCIGLLVSAPLAVAVFLYAYEDIFGGNSGSRQTGAPPAPPLVAAAAAGPGRPASPPRPPAPGKPDGTRVPPVSPPVPPAGGISRGITYGLLIFAGLAALMLVTIPLILYVHWRRAADQTFEVRVGPTSATAPDDYDHLVERTRRELDKAGVSFDTLRVSSTNDHELLISFIGVQQLARWDGTNNTEKAISGSLVGKNEHSDVWEFSGREQMPEIHFDITGLDLRQVLAEAGAHGPAAPAAAENVHEALADRLEAAKTIGDGSLKDAALKPLALEAAGVGDEDTLKSVLEQMDSYEDRDEATREAALALVKAGDRKLAIEIAKDINDTSLRDKTLAELAQ